MMDMLLNSLSSLLPHRARPRSEVKRIIVLVSGANPTFDYYIAPRIAMVDYRVVDLESNATPEGILDDGDYVLVCRYINFRWAAAIRRCGFLAGVGYFFDDDLIAFSVDTTIPLNYRSHVALRTFVPIQLFRRKVTDVFVSTPALNRRYTGGHSNILHPIPSLQDLEGPSLEPNRPLRIAMHAQLSHLAEHAFAAEVMREVRQRIERVEIDVIGPAEAFRMWEDVPGVSFRPEMPWNDYRRESAQRPVDVMIAPLLATAVNVARAPTKAIDAVRMGAAAVFSSLEPYAELEETAVLVGADQTAWRDAIIMLAIDPEIRRRKARELRDKVRTWRNLIQPLL